MRRYAGRTNAHSKAPAQPPVDAGDLLTHYNFCRVHSSLGHDARRGGGARVAGLVYEVAGGGRPACLLERRQPAASRDARGLIRRNPATLSGITPSEEAC